MFRLWRATGIVGCICAVIARSLAAEDVDGTGINVTYTIESVAGRDARTPTSVQIVRNPEGNVAALRLLEASSGATQLTVSSDLGSETLGILRGFVNVRRLEFPPGSNEKSMAILPFYPRLQKLVVDAAITATHLEHVGGCRELVSLQMTNLRELPKNALRPLAAISGLRDVRLVFRTGRRGDGDPVNDEDLEFLAKNPQCTRLYVQGWRANEKGVEAITKCQEVGELWLIGCKVTEDDVGRLKALKKLRRLDLSANPISGRGFGHWPTDSALQSLDLSYCPITNAGVECIAEKIRPGTLLLDRAELTDACAESLVRMSSLRELRLDECDIGDVGAAVVALHPGIEELSLIGTEVTDGSMDEIRGMKGLRTVWIGNTAITDRGLETLAGGKSIKCIKTRERSFIREGSMTSDGIAKVRAKYPQLLLEGF